MKCTIPEISWHNRDPVLSVDIQPGCAIDNFERLATGGTDSHVVIWHIETQENGSVKVEFAADLQRHQKAVNVVRFSPSGEFLASGDDESVIIIWKQKTDQDAPELPLGDSDNMAKEQWLGIRVLRGHMEDVYDLSWSPDSLNLISGSVDNSAILWDVHKGRNLAILKEHKGFVQGVTWDPSNQYVATLSSDRTCRVYSINSKKVVSRISKSSLPVPKSSDLHGKVVRLFHDDTLKSFFRRLTFSPDGQLLITPSGIVENPDSDKNSNATYIFTRRLLNRPSVLLPSSNQYTVAVRCCPLLFELKDRESVFALPYRMILAVATQNSVLLYDTQQPEPFGIVSNIHYTRLTDLTWSDNGRILVVSSTDGYCSIVTFSDGELGKIYKPKKESASDECTRASDIDISEVKRAGTSAVNTSEIKDQILNGTSIKSPKTEILSCNLNITDTRQGVSNQTKVQLTSNSSDHSALSSLHSPTSDKAVNNFIHSPSSSRTVNNLVQPSETSKIMYNLIQPQTKDERTNCETVSEFENSPKNSKTSFCASSGIKNLPKPTKTPRRITPILLSSPKKKPFCSVGKVTTPTKTPKTIHPIVAHEPYKSDEIMCSKDTSAVVPASSCLLEDDRECARFVDSDSGKSINHGKEDGVNETPGKENHLDQTDDTLPAEMSDSTLKTEEKVRSRNSESKLPVPTQVEGTLANHTEMITDSVDTDSISTTVPLSESVPVEIAIGGDNYSLTNLPGKENHLDQTDGSLSAEMSDSTLKTEEKVWSRKSESELPRNESTQVEGTLANHTEMITDSVDTDSISTTVPSSESVPVEIATGGDNYSFPNLPGKENHLDQTDGSLSAEMSDSTLKTEEKVWSRKSESELPRNESTQVEGTLANRTEMITDSVDTDSMPKTVPSSESVPVGIATGGDNYTLTNLPGKENHLDQTDGSLSAEMSDSTLKTEEKVWSRKSESELPRNESTQVEGTLANHTEMITDSVDTDSMPKTVPSSESVPVGIATIGGSAAAEKLEPMDSNATPPVSPLQSNTVRSGQEKRTPRRVQFITLSSPKSKKKLL